jgi:AraC-like DNA-binding protein
MLQICRIVVDGRSYEDIQQELGLSRRTFYRYLQLVLERIRRSQKIDNNFSYNFQILNFKHVDIVSLKNKKKVVDC